MKLSFLLSKTVLSLYNGTNEGIVISGYFDKTLKKLQELEIVSQEDELVDEYLLPIKSILGIGQDAITIKNNTVLELKLESERSNYSPINNFAYTTNGLYLGKISDVELNEKFEVVNFILGENYYSIDAVASHSKNTIIFYDKDFTIKVEKFKPINKIKRKAEKYANLPKAYIQPYAHTKEESKNDNETTTSESENSEENTQAHKSEPLETFENTQAENDTKTLENIKRLSTNTSLLLGKKVIKNITTPNGELIAKKGNIITNRTLALAESYQKIRELILYSK